LWNEVLTARRRVLSSDDPDLFESLDCVASANQNGGRYEAAEKLYLEEIAGRTRVQGADHSSTLWAMNNLGNVYMQQHRYDKAERLLDTTLQVMGRVLGENHPDTAAAMVSLAHLAALRGDREKSIGWIRRAVEHGYPSAGALAGDADLKSLRGDPAFEALV